MPRSAPIARQGNYTVLQNGVYTACEPCKNDPKKPPLWQVQAARIIHDQTEKMLYFEDARIEFFGVPLAWVPFMSAPDPTVKRKSGFLFPTVSDTTQYGFGVEVPYYWALAPNADVTVSTMATTRQGELFQGEWRHRLMDGAYSIKAAGIFQQDPGYFAARDGANSPTAASFRGAVQTAGQFALGDQWVWGWTGILVTDSQFLYDYRRSQFTPSFDPFLTGVAAEGVSQVYLTGTGDRSYFDIRSIYYYGFSNSGRAKPASGHPSGARLFQRAGAASGGRRVQLQDQSHQPQPAGSKLRRDQPDRRQQRLLRQQHRRYRGPHPLELPVARHTGRLQPLLRRDRLAPHAGHL